MDYSYSYQNLKRDLSDVITTSILAAPVFLSIVPIRGEATNTKHEWLQDKLQPQQSTAATTINSSATAFDVAAGTGVVFKVGDIIVNTATDERLKITGISTDTLTVVRGVGGTAAAVTTADKIKLVARPKLQGTQPGDDAGQQPTPEYNYTQIYDRTAVVTKTAQAVLQYGIDNALDYQVKIQMDALAREMNMNAIYGIRQAPSAGVPGMSGGLLSFLDQAGGNAVDAAGGALTKTMLNDALEAAFNSGAGELVIVTSPHQARKITGLDTYYRTTRSDTTTGFAVMEYMGDIAGANQASKIVVDPNYPTKRIDFVDPSRLALVPLRGRAMSDEDATPNGADYVSRRVLGEYTLEVKNALQAHAVVKNLAL